MGSINDKAKELCNESGCHHKCHDTTDCVVEDDAELLINQDKSNNFEGKSNNELFKQALVEGVNRHIDKDLQIEEMVKIIEEKNCIGVLCSECEFFNNSRCSKFYIAKALYNAGYRKQIEGEWEIAVNSVEAAFICSECGYFYIEADPQAEPEYKYCPNCGARMRGENNG